MVKHIHQRGDCGHSRNQMKFGRWKAMCSESREGESGGGTVGYHAVKVNSHGKTMDQDNSQHPKSIYPLGSGDEGFRWILNLGTTPREYDLLSFAGMDFEVVFWLPMTEYC